MPNFNSSNTSKGVNRSKKRKTRKNDPFAKPEHPLGYNFLSEERPIRATKFNALLPSIVAKYGLGRSLTADQFQNAWKQALQDVFADQNEYYDYSYSDGDIDSFAQNSPQNYVPDKAAMFLKYAKAVSIRGGVLRVEIVSNILYQELQFYQVPILQRLRQLLPNKNIEKIKFVVK